LAVKAVQLVDGLLLDKRQDVGRPRVLPRVIGVVRIGDFLVGGRESAVRIVMIVQRQHQLFEIVTALGAAGGLARRLNCRQE
jgi:hypothetical protein